MNELGRLVRVRVEAVVQPLAGDLGDPGVVVLLAVDAVDVQFVGEIGVGVGMCGRGEQRATDAIAADSEASYYLSLPSF